MRGKEIFLVHKRILKLERIEVHINLKMSLLSGGVMRKRGKRREGGREAGKKGDEEAVLFLQSSLGGNGESRPGWGWHSPRFWRREFRCRELKVLLHPGVHPGKKLSQAELRFQRPAPSLSWTKQVTTDPAKSIQVLPWPD